MYLHKYFVVVIASSQCIQLRLCLMDNSKSLSFFSFVKALTRLLPKFCFEVRGPLRYLRVMQSFFDF